MMKNDVITDLCPGSQSDNRVVQGEPIGTFVYKLARNSIPEKKCQQNERWWFNR